MNARDLLTRIYTSEEIKELTQKLEPKHLADDIIQHVFTELYAKPDDFIFELEQRQKLKPYIVKQIWNLTHYTEDRFNRQYRTVRERATDFCEPSVYELRHYEGPRERRDAQDTVAELKTHLSQMHWYKARVFELYAELGTYRAVSEVTGIPTTSVYRTVQELKKELKQKL